MKFFFLPLILLFGSLSYHDAETFNSGVIEIRLIRYQEDKIESVLVQKVWFDNEFAIEEIRSEAMITDNRGVSVSNYPVTTFRFNDLRNRKAFVFSSFTDSARIVSQYSFDRKKGIEIPGGFGFHEIKTIEFSGAAQSLKDTVEQGFIVRRLKVFSNTAGRISYSELSFSCQIPTFFDLATNLSPQTGCPCFRQVVNVPGKPVAMFKIELVLVRNKLTDKERKLFRSWIDKTK